MVAYRNDLYQLAEFIEGEAVESVIIPPWAGFDRQAMLRYLLSLKERGYVATTQARKVAAVKSFFDFMVAEGAMKTSPAEGVTSPKTGKSLPKPISISQARSLIEQPSKLSPPDAKRDKAKLQVV